MYMNVNQFACIYSIAALHALSNKVDFLLVHHIASNNSPEGDVRRHWLKMCKMLNLLDVVCLPQNFRGFLSSDGP